MKAKAGFLMLLIGLMCFTGFGNTTADLTDNSTNKLVQTDCLLNVVAAPVMDVVFNSFHSEADFVLAVNTDVSPVTDFVTNITLVSSLNLPAEDVGWQANSVNYNYTATLNLNNIKDSGGKLSLFYI